MAAEIPGQTHDADDVILAVHGGAGVPSRAELTPQREAEVRALLQAALEAGRDVLAHGDATSLDAVIAAIVLLEDSPLFNAGKGAVFTRDGRNELDASVMDGGTRRAGAVAGVTTVKNPILAARAVMERTPHVLLIGRGADEFAKEVGLEIVDPSYFRTDEQWRKFQERIEREKNKKTAGASAASGIRQPDAHRYLGTVGAVAVDRRGNLAAGTSTGGLWLKRFGRVGDSPIVGAGTFADNRTCAVSGTGDGEYFIRAAAAHDISALVEYKGLSVAAAADEVIRHKIKDAGGDGGVIVLDARGHLAMSYNTDGLYRGYLTKSGQIRVLVYGE